MGDEDFDTWFDEAAEAENQAGMQNQAAKFDTKAEESRTRQEGAFGAECALAGQFFCKFANPADDTKTFRRAFSGHIAKKQDDGTYIALTAAHCLNFKDDGGNTCDLQDGYFFLQKNGADYAAKFSWSAEDVKFYTDYNVETANPGLTGQDVAAIKLTLKGEPKSAIPEVPELSEVEFTAGEPLEGEYTVSGYPEQSIKTLTEEDEKAGTSKYVSEGKHLFKETGAIELVVQCDETDGAYAVFSMDATPGQDGGALTNAEGKVIAIYSQIEKVEQENLNDDFYCATVVSASFVEWFGDLSF